MEHRKRQTLRTMGRIGKSPLDLMDVSQPVSKRRKSNEDVVVVSDLLARLPVGSEEIGLLRAFLSAEIDAILRGDDRG